MGALTSNTVIPGITLIFKRSMTQEAELQALLAAQQNKASPLYHQWLTPESFAARFGMANEDIAATEAWLRSHGFVVERVGRSRDRITFTGTAAQVDSAFGAELHHYQAESETHFAPASELTMPTELAAVTAAVVHLSDFRPKANVIVKAGPHPDYTTLATQSHYLGPKDIATMYDLNAPGQTSYFGDGGGGQGLAVVGQSFVHVGEPSSLQTFQASLAEYDPVNMVLVPGSGVEDISPGDEGESEIDLEYSSGISTASMFLVYVGDNQNYSVFDALAFAIETDVAPIVSISYGVCEALLPSNELDENNSLFEEAAAQGQTLVAAAGDSGSTACAPFTTADGVTLAEQQALAVSFPASSPYVTAVGGTQMAAGTYAKGDNTYWQSASGYGDTVSSLLSYVPEVVWNEGSATNGIIAGGGGTSSYFARPTWQSGVVGIQGGAYRTLPDVALQASVESPGFLVCSSDPYLYAAQGQTASCSDGLVGSNDGYTLAGGTSFAAPIFAGFLAILNAAENATGQGNINPVLYGLAADATTYAAVFHDITSGTNACVAGAGSCAAAGESNYSATTGYDEATGLGSVDFRALLANWPATSSANLIPSFTGLFGLVTTAAPGDTVAVPISIQPSSAVVNPPVPTGSVLISVDGVVQPALALTPANTYYPNAIASYNFVAPATTGSHLIVVTYPGDASYSASKATFAILVGDGLATGSISVAAGNLMVENPGTGNTQVAVTPSGGYSGRVTWSLSYPGTNTASDVCYAIASLPVNNVSTTQLTIGVGTACNSPLPAERGSYRPVVRRAVAMNEIPRGRRTVPETIACLSLLTWGLVRRRRGSGLMLLGMSMCVAAGGGLTGCGGGGSVGSTVTPPVSPATTYSLVLTGADSVNGAITTSTTFTLTVN